MLKKNKIWTWLFIVILLVGLGGLLWFATTPAPGSDQANPMVSYSGLHWHPHLSIMIKGQIQEIPAGIGLGATESPVHTHEADGIIHLEFVGPVRESDITLGKFFKLWGKRFSSDCIFDDCTGVAGMVKLFVNGQENFLFENYSMQEKDEMEIRYE